MCLISQWDRRRITFFETILVAINLRKSVPYNSNCMGQNRIQVYEGVQIFK
jgi:hypothetical protein